MSPNVHVPIWTRGINFKVYASEQEYTHDQLVNSLSQFEGDFKKKKAGWELEPICISEDKKFSCFEYVHFKKNGNATKVQGSQVYETDGAGIMFDIKNKTIIPATTSIQKLSSLIENNAFKAVREITEPRGYSYSNDFLFWLTFNYMTGKPAILPKTQIDAITILKSNREEGHLTDSIRGFGDVTGHTESHVILGLCGDLSAINVLLNSNGKDYNFNINSDGRIQVPMDENLETIEEKHEHAMEIHSILQKAYDEYNKYVKNNDWPLIKREFRIRLVKKCKWRITKIGQRYGIRKNKFAFLMQLLG